MNTPTDNVCPIWHEPAEGGYSGHLLYAYDSPRAGGAYQIDMRAYNWLSPDDELTRVKLTTWLVDQRRAGIDRPAITGDVIELVKLRPSLNLSDRIDRFFLYLSGLGAKIGQNYSLILKPYQENYMAWTESRDDEELKGIIDLMSQMGLLQVRSSRGEFTISPSGYERMDRLQNRSTTSLQAFVAMWFGQELNNAYSAGFSAGISDAGYRPFRIDEKEHSNKIDDEIVSEIKRSRFVVADFTCPVIKSDSGLIIPNARGGVYYEAGFAQGLQIPVIWTVRADCLLHVHFDTRQFAHIVWNDPDDLRTSLRNRIMAVIN